jgi:hypothetical protein
MSLLGARAWWMPRWLDRVVPDGQVQTDCTTCDTGGGAGTARLS